MNSVRDQVMHALSSFETSMAFAAPEMASTHMAVLRERIIDAFDVDNLEDDAVGEDDEYGDEGTLYAIEDDE